MQLHLRFLGAIVILLILAACSETPNPLQYQRTDWKHWIDVDRDCQNTRHEVLQEESLVPVTFRTDQRCVVRSGLWLDPFTNSMITEARQLDVDHMVPLKNAHISGAWAWDRERRQDYANDMNDPSHLIAVTATANRGKGARGPEEWRPANTAYWCSYATDWKRIKTTWNLEITPAESEALKDMIQTC